MHRLAVARCLCVDSLRAFVHIQNVDLKFLREVERRPGAGSSECDDDIRCCHEKGTDCSGQFPVCVLKFRVVPDMNLLRPGLISANFRLRDSRAVFISKNNLKEFQCTLMEYTCFSK